MIERNLCRLEDVCDFQNGFAFKSTSFTKEGEPILRISDIQGGKVDDSNVVYFNPSSYKEDLSRFVVYPNDIVIAMSGGTTGKVGVNTTGKSFYLNQRVGVFREKEMLNHSYLYYYLLTKSEESLRIAAGAAQPNLSTAQIKSFIIPIPHLDEQQRIVDTIDAEFAKIDALKENAEKNLQNAKDLFQAVLRKELKPKDGWIISTLKELLILKSGDNLTAKSIVEGSYPVYGGNGILGYHNEYNLDGHNVLVGRVGALCGNVRLTEGKLWYTDNCFLVCDKTGSFYLPYLSYVLQNANLRQYATQAAQPVVSNTSMKDVLLTLPPMMEEQQRIADGLNILKNNCEQLQINYEKTITLCNDLKQALLRKAFNGEL